MSDMIAVPREPIQEMVDKAMCCEGGFGWREIWSAMLAASPATHVPVPRELCERLLGDSDVYPKALFELRALLSPAPSSGTDNKEQSK